MQIGRVSVETSTLHSLSLVLMLKTKSSLYIHFKKNILMKKINEKDLKFFDFILPIFSEDINASYYLEQYAKDYKLKTGIEFTVNDLRTFIDEYDDKYIIKSGSGLVVKISIDTKRIIDHHGSLTKYLSKYNKSNKRHKISETAKQITPIITIVLLFLSTVVFGILSLNLNNKIDKLENKIIKKDSIILELNNKIKNIDSLIIKAP